MKQFDSKASKKEWLINTRFMRIALGEARRSATNGGIPVGCILVNNNIIISRGHNKRVQHNDPISHAEIICIRKALKWKMDLSGCTLYTTHMPCYLCSGAIIQFGISKVVSGESISFPHAKYILEQNQVNVTDMRLVECQEIVEKYIIKNKELWKENSIKNTPNIILDDNETKQGNDKL